MEVIAALLTGLNVQIVNILDRSCLKACTRIEIAAQSDAFARPSLHWLL